MRIVGRTRLRARQEEGFALAEAVVALGVLFVALSLLGSTLIRAFSSVAVARQRQAATALANQLLEQVRAMPFDELDMGNSDLAASVAAGEDGLTVEGSGTTAVYRFRGREIPRADVTSRAPVVPHTVVSTPGPSATRFTRRLYVTQDPAYPAARIVTARVTWTPFTRTSGAEVQVETLVTGYQCVAQSGPRPCESYWYAQADAGDGAVDATGTILDQPATQLTLHLTGRSAAITTEQLNDVRGTASLPEASSNLAGAVTLGGSGGQAAAAADDALATASGDYDNPAPVGPGATRSVAVSGSLPGLAATLTTSMAADGTAGAMAAAAAAGQTALMGGGTNYVLNNDGLPSGRARATSGGAVTTALDITVGLGKIGLATLLSVPATGSTGTAFVDRLPGADVNTPNDDAIQASAQRTLTTGNLDLLGLPAGALPGAAWGGYLVRLSNWSASATAAAGPGALASGTVVSQAGTLSYWNSATNSYTTVNLASASLDGVPVSASASLGSCGFTLGGTLSAGGSSTSVDYLGGDATQPITAARAVANPPLAGTFTYRVVCSGVTVAALSFDVSLATTVAEAKFAVPGA